MTDIGRLSGLFACKSVESLIAESERPETEVALPRTLSFFSLTCFGVGSTIGAGIFVLTGTVAAAHAGPAFAAAMAAARCGTDLEGDNRLYGWQIAVMIANRAARVGPL
jgi:basic amino acid/polyamine antiporter, APA family